MQDKEFGTVGELIQYLQTFPKDAKMIVQKDSEGNGYSPLASVWSGLYVPESTYSGEMWDIPDGPIEGSELAVVLGPTN